MYEVSPIGTFNQLNKGSAAWLIVGNSKTFLYIKLLNERWEGLLIWDPGFGIQNQFILELDSIFAWFSAHALHPIAEGLLCRAVIGRTT